MDPEFVIDQMGFKVEIPSQITSIVSLVPSQTEFLCSIGAEENISGITKFCVHPDHLKSVKTVVGGTKNFKIDKIVEISPDLIIGNKEENEKSKIEELRRRFPIWMSDISNLQDAFEMMNQIGNIVRKQKQAMEVIKKIKTGVEKLPKIIRRSCLYLIWRNPFIGVGKGTFIHDMLSKVGFKNVIESERYPELDLSKLKDLKPEYVLLSSEPYPFREKHLIDLKRIFSTSEIRLVDGEMFSWYGSRLIKSVDYFKKLQKDLRLN